MQFSFSFFLHFILSFVGFLFLGIYLFRGSWRNQLRWPLQIGLGLILLAHMWNSAGPFSALGKLVLVLLLAVQVIVVWRKRNFVPTPVREGHNMLSLLAGAALFALAVQLHSVLIGIPVFNLVK